MSEKIVQLNGEAIKGQIRELVRGDEERRGYRSGHFSRNLTTASGDVTRSVPRLRGIVFETAIIERYRRRESSAEEAAKKIEESAGETLTYTLFPIVHRTRIRTQ